MRLTAPLLLPVPNKNAGRSLRSVDTSSSLLDSSKEALGSFAAKLGKSPVPYCVAYCIENCCATGFVCEPQAEDDLCCSLRDGA